MEVVKNVGIDVRGRGGGTYADLLKAKLLW
jgi:hypothetical protein